MRTIHIHGSRESDFIDIWRYRFERSGELQADKDLDELGSGMRSLVENPESGMRRDDARIANQMSFVGNHAVYRAMTPDGVHNIRIVRGHMDPGMHLQRSHS